MAIPDVADDYFTYENRLASFQIAQQVSKRRASNASSKGPKSLKWPHKFLSPEELARAGFFHYPSQDSPDNTACFLCRRSLDGWEKGDDPLVEHLKHSPDCGWAIVATIEKQDGDLSREYPATTRMIEARKATFADKWPHENKKGWKCKTKQLVDAGWKYTPTPEYDDMATCTYCQLALDGWEPSDKPMDEHFKRSPECPFFTLINNHKQSPAAKHIKAKKDRTSKVSRLSTQSAFTVASDTASIADLPAEEGDSILTTATNATTITTQGAKRMVKGKKAVSSKGRKTKAKKDEAVEVPAPEPEDDDFEVKIDLAPKPTRGKKRKSEDTIDSTEKVTEAEAPPPKRRATRTRASVASEGTILGPDESALIATASKGQKKGRQSTRKTSAASVASLRAPVPNDDELDAALQADLDQRLTDDEGISSKPKRATRLSKIGKVDHAMFGAETLEIDEAAIEAELEAMETESKPLPKAKGAKGRQPRKASAKQQAAAKKAAEAEAEAATKKAAEEEKDASQQIATELEHSISIQHSSPGLGVQPKRLRAPSRQPSRQMSGRSTRGGSVLSMNESTMVMADETVTGQNEDSGNETDASMASQSTVVRAGKTRRGSTTKTGRGRGKAASRNIEEIVHKPSIVTSPPEDSSTAEERFYTPAPEIHPPAVNEPPRKVPTPKATKSRGRPAKAAPAPVPAALEASTEMDYDMTEQAPILPPSKPAKAKDTAPPQSHTPPPKERTPSQSPQSSDAENHPPSSKPPASIKNTVTPRTTATRVPLAATTPGMSPSKRNIIAGLQSINPWTAVDLDAIFLKSPGDENAPGKGLLGDAMGKIKSGDLTSPEKRMSVEEWIHYNAEIAEEELRNECERMVGSFERQGTRAMQALEGVECME